MSDSVKFIFKTLLKVPIIVVVSFFILNIFAFFFIYFKTLGLSYVVMQEVVENNYITSSQLTQISKYFKSINDIPMASNTSLIVGEDKSNKPVYLKVDSSGNLISGSYNKSPDTTADGYKLATKRVQYGQQRMVGVHCEYTLIWPLSYQATIGGKDVDGIAKGASKNEKYGDVLEVTSTYKEKDDTFSNAADAADGKVDHKVKITLPIDLYYIVPGLKYYSDL